MLIIATLLIPKCKNCTPGESQCSARCGILCRGGVLASVGINGAIEDAGDEGGSTSRRPARGGWLRQRGSFRAVLHVPASGNAVTRSPWGHAHWGKWAQHPASRNALSDLEMLNDEIEFEETFHGILTTTKFEGFW